MQALLVVGVVFGLAVVLVLPVKLAAVAVGAGRTGAGRCFLALVAASFAHALGLSFPLWGSLIAFLLSCAVFAAVLHTTFVRGIGIAVLHAVFSLILVLILVSVLGLSLTAL